MFPQDALQYVEKCFNGEPASCTFACPYHLDIRGFLKKASRGRWDSCYKDLMNTMAFPTVACALCGKACESSCQRTLLGDAPVNIYEIEKTCFANAKSHSPEIFGTVAKTQKIAVIGGGIAGLSAAFTLSQKQYHIDLFEKSDAIGGTLKLHPDYAAFKEDFDSKFTSGLVEFHIGSSVNALDELGEYDAVVLATGKNGSFAQLASTRSKAFMTEKASVFACGELCGTDLCYALSEGLKIANAVEAYLISGSPDYGAVEENPENCSRFVNHTGEASKPAIVKTGDVYTKDEAKQEAARCMQCNCDSCMKVCEHMRKHKKNPLKLANEVYMDSLVRRPITSHSATRIVYSCNLCGKCKDVCPVGSDLAGMFRFSRKSRVERKDYPPAFHDFWLRSQKYYTGSAAFSFTPENSGCEYAFFPGCQLGAANPEYVKRAYAFLKENYGAGIISTCCGAPSYWAGEDKIFNENAEKIRTQWEKMGKPKLVTACATCTKMLKMLLPEAELVSLYVLLNEKEAAGSSAGVLSVFDPCAASHNEEEKAAVRELLKRSGAELSGYDSEGKCCGNGGHIRLADPLLYEEITKNRAGESEYPYVVYCVNCREVFAAKNKKCRHILETVFDFDAGKTPTLEEKFRNGLQTKREMLEKYTGESFAVDVPEWYDLPISVPETAREYAEDKMITDYDIRETVYHSERENTGFCTDDAYLATMTRKYLTYWVKYRKNDEIYEILDVYCHRMKVREDDGTATMQGKSFNGS